MKMRVECPSCAQPIEVQTESDEEIFAGRQAEREAARLHGLGNNVERGALILAGLVLAILIIRVLFAGSTSSYPEGAREHVGAGELICYGLLFTLSGALWFAAQLLHIRAALERRR